MKKETIKMRISYITPEALESVIKLFEHVPHKCKLEPAKGAYSRAYIELDAPVETAVKTTKSTRRKGFD